MHLYCDVFFVCMNVGDGVRSFAWTHNIIYTAGHHHSFLTCSELVFMPIFILKMPSFTNALCIVKPDEYVSDLKFL